METIDGDKVMRATGMEWEADRDGSSSEDLKAGSSMIDHLPCDMNVSGHLKRMDSEARIGTAERVEDQI